MGPNPSRATRPVQVFSSPSGLSLPIFTMGHQGVCEQQGDAGVPGSALLEPSSDDTAPQHP